MKGPIIKKKKKVVYFRSSVSRFLLPEISCIWEGGETERNQEEEKAEGRRKEKAAAAAAAAAEPTGVREPTGAAEEVSDVWGSFSHQYRKVVSLWAQKGRHEEADNFISYIRHGKRRNLRGPAVLQTRWREGLGGCSGRWRGVYVTPLQLHSPRLLL